MINFSYTDILNDVLERCDSVNAPAIDRFGALTSLVIKTRFNVNFLPSSIDKREIETLITALSAIK